MILYLYILNQCLNHGYPIKDCKPLCGPWFVSCASETKLATIMWLWHLLQCNHDSYNIFCDRRCSCYCLQVSGLVGLNGIFGLACRADLKWMGLCCHLVVKFCSFQNHWRLNYILQLSFTVNRSLCSLPPKMKTVWYDWISHEKKKDGIFKSYWFFETESFFCSQYHLFTTTHNTPTTTFSKTV